MKRLFCLITVCLMVITGACAESIYATMTDEQLLSVIAAARSELASRQQQDYLVNDEQIRIYKTGQGRFGSYTSEMGVQNYAEMEVVIENISDSAFEVFMDKVTINGWETDPISSRSGKIDAGMKRKWYFEILYSDAGISDPEEIKEVTFSFSVGEMFEQRKEYKISIVLNEG